MVQAYTPDTPIEAYRREYLHRHAMCQALVTKYADFGPIAAEAGAVVTAIDGRLADLQRAEDAHVRARALEVAAKLDVVEVYELVRAQFAVYHKGTLFAFLPASPSSLARAGVKAAEQRVSEAIANLRSLPEQDEVRKDFLPRLEQEQADLRAADLAEDDVRRAVRTVALGLTTYKSELAGLRDRQLGQVQVIMKDRAKTEMFTLPWRKRSTNEEPEPVEPADGPTPARPPT
ncbi:MAG: hypothetical protein MUF54_21130 [Polyangiaceae bacterium]|jgi:hypothetical protein|nr:hypothetical protein [Polyangiaceae bacterium]